MTPVRLDGAIVLGRRGVRLRRSTTPAFNPGPKPTVPTTTALLGMVSEATGKTHPESWAADTTTIGRTLDYDSFYYHTDDDFPTADTSSSDPAPTATMVTWFGWPSTDVNAGTYDATITARAEALRDLAKPIFLRWDIEFNIASYGYGPDPEYDSSNAPDFILAWQRVYGLFQDVGATNVAFCWTPNFEGPDDPDGWQPFYPGDDYVDWVGVDAYNFGNSTEPSGSTWQTMYQVAHAFFDDYATGFGGAMVDTKPVMIGEGASVEGGGSKSWWLTDAAGFLRSRGLQAWTYFNTDTSSTGNDYRFDSSETAQASFIEIVQDPFWGGSDTRGSGYATAVLADSPLAYWKFDELTGSYADSSGNSHSASLAGTVSTRGCPALYGGLGPSYSAYGSGYLNLGTLGSFGSGMGSGFTISFLYKHGGGTTKATLLGFLNTGTTTALWIDMNADHSGNSAGKTYIAMRGENGTQRYTDLPATTVLYDGYWHLVQWVCQPGVAGGDIVRIDGTVVTPSASTNPTVATFVNLGFSMFVGGRSNRGSVDQTWVAGAIDELAIFPTKLTTTRLDAHYTALSA